MIYSVSTACTSSQRRYIKAIHTKKQLNRNNKTKQIQGNDKNILGHISVGDIEIPVIYSKSKQEPGKLYSHFDKL